MASLFLSSDSTTTAPPQMFDVVLNVVCVETPSDCDGIPYMCMHGTRQLLCNTRAEDFLCHPNGRRTATVAVAPHVDAAAAALGLLMRCPVMDVVHAVLQFAVP